MDTPASVTATLPLEVEDFLLWLTTERGRSANTVMAYRRDLTKYVAFLGEHEETPSSVGADLIVSFIAFREAQGAAPTSIARNLAAVRMLHRFLVTEGLRSDDPTNHLDGVKVPSGIPKPLDEESVIKLIEACSAGDPLSRAHHPFRQCRRAQTCQPRARRRAPDGRTGSRGWRTRGAVPEPVRVIRPHRQRTRR